MGKKSKRSRPRKKATSLAQQEPRLREQHGIQSHTEPENFVGLNHIQLQTKAFQLRGRLVDMMERDAPDKWVVGGLQSMENYSTCLINLLNGIDSEERCYDTTEDRKLVKKLSQSPHEPSFIQATATILWASLCRVHCEFEDAAQLFLGAIKMCDNASEEEKLNVQFIALNGNTRMQSAKRNAQENLKHLRSFDTGITLPPTGRSPSFLGCERCDVCGKTAQDLGVTMLPCCYKCQMAYYCSRECQTHDWKQGGHKKVCRKRREFCPGDKAYYVHLGPSLGIRFGSEVYILGGGDACARWFHHQGKEAPDPDCQGYFLVAFASCQPPHAVHCSHLRRMRSRLLQCKFSPEDIMDFVSVAKTPDLAAIVFGEDKDVAEFAGADNREH